VPALLGEQFPGVALVHAQPLARVARLHPPKLGSVPDLHHGVLCAMARAQRSLLGEGRVRSLLPLASVPAGQLSVVAAVPGVELLMRRQMPLRHLCVVADMPTLDFGVLRRVPLPGGGG